MSPDRSAEAIPDAGREDGPRDRRTIESYYDDYSSWYETERRAGYYGIINDLEAELVAEAGRGADVLEIGCGTGLILERTARVAANAVGIDLSHGMASFSRDKGLRTLQASATALPFADRSFDVVCSFKVLPHVPDIHTALREVERVLEPGGEAYLEFYNRMSFKALAERVRASRRGDSPVFNRYDDLARIRSYLPERLEIVGLRGVRIFGPTRHFYTLPVLGALVAWLERTFCDTWLGKRFGGYLVVRARKVR